MFLSAVLSTSFAAFVVWGYSVLLQVNSLSSVELAFLKVPMEVDEVIEFLFHLNLLPCILPKTPKKTRKVKPKNKQESHSPRVFASTLLSLSCRL